MENKVSNSKSIKCKHKLFKCQKCSAYFCSGTCEFWGQNLLAFGFAQNEDLKKYSTPDSIFFEGKKHVYNLVYDDKKYNFKEGLCPFHDPKNKLWYVPHPEI